MNHVENSDVGKSRPWK